MLLVVLLGVSRKQDPSFFHLLPANRTETGLQAESALRSDYLLSLGKTESCEPNFKNFYLFIFGGTGSSLLQTGYSLLTVHGLLIEGLLLLQSTGFRACRLKSCGSQAWLLQGTWSLPGPGIQPVFPALAGGFLTTEPPGRSEPNLACLCFLTLKASWGWCLSLERPPGRGGAARPPVKCAIRRFWEVPLCLGLSDAGRPPSGSLLPSLFALCPQSGLSLGNRA